MNWRDEVLTKGEMHDALSESIAAVQSYHNAFKDKIPHHLPGAKKLRDIIDDGFNAALEALSEAALSLSGGADNGMEG